jgi:hypothetical protein
MRPAEKIPFPESRRAGVDIQPRALYTEKDSSALDADLNFSHLEYWLLLKKYWRRVMLISSIATLIAFAMTSFVMTKYYRAFAIIRPVGEHAELGNLERNLPGFVDLTAGMSFSPFSAESERAQEYMAVLGSYDFSTNLIQSHHLEQWVNAEAGSVLFHNTKPVSDWDRYNLLKNRFENKYDLVTGSLELSFIDRNPETAKQMLRFYLDGLREKLRQEDIAAAKVAVASLTAETRGSGDPFLTSQLSELISRQVQREKLAEVEAEFAFKVIDSPVVPNRPYRPNPLVDSAAVGVAVFILMLSWILIGDFQRRSSRIFQAHRD